MRWLMGVSLLAVLMVPVEAKRADAPDRNSVAGATSPADGASLRLLSYNVEDLPWPLVASRTTDLHAIAATLSDERQRGEQPRVVALQEAFGDDAKAIGAEAGYRYAAFGPSAGETSAVPASAADRAFAAAASFWSGEGGHRFAGSGLAVFSDYPIEWTRRIAFPAFACAGWDCLANKGALAVALRIPGAPAPVVVVDTHLNARAAAGVPFARSAYAFRRQVEILGAFMGRLHAGSGALMLTGDFNVGRDAVRAAMMRGLIAAEGLSVAAAEHACGGGCRRAEATISDPATGIGAIKSLILYRGVGGLVPSPVAAFGRMANGAMLSDHIGLAVKFARAVRPAGMRRPGITNA